MMMTTFPWIQTLIGGLFALMKLDRYLAFGRTLATVKKIVASRFANITRVPLVEGVTQYGLQPDIISGFYAAGFNVGETAANLNVQSYVSDIFLASPVLSSKSDRIPIRIASFGVTNPAIAHLCGKYTLQARDEQEHIRRELTNFFRTVSSGAPAHLQRTVYPHTVALMDESRRTCVPAPFFREKRTRCEGYPRYSIPGSTLIG
jgi:hypothetical protein